MAKWRFEKEGKPLLQAGESPKSFKQRVAAWEKETGREYVPMGFGDEAKILSGKTTIGGWGNQTDYFSNDSLVNEQNIKAGMGLGDEAIYARALERDKEYDRMKESGESEEVDPRSIQHASEKYEKAKAEANTPVGKLKALIQRQAEGEEITDDQWEGYLRDFGSEYGGTRMPTGPDTTDEEISQAIDDDDYIYQTKKAEFSKRVAEEGMAIENERYLKSVSQDGLNRTYTTNYREAVKNAAGWSRFYDEQEGGRPVERSDVFTIDPETGMPVGVMTRNQRRAFDNQRHFAKYGSGSTTSTEESEEQEWGPGGQPKASDQLKKYKPIETPTKIETNSEVTAKVTENIDKTLNNDDDDDNDDKKIIGG